MRAFAAQPCCVAGTSSASRLVAAAEHSRPCLVGRPGYLRMRVPFGAISQQISRAVLSESTASLRCTVTSSSCGFGAEQLRPLGRRAGQALQQARGAADVAEATTETSSEQGSTQKAATERRKRVLSGVQPTGSLHLGNYLGAMRNWVGLQELYDTYFCVVDMHAITMPHDPKDLLTSSRSAAALYIACGIDPAKASVFVQSHVPAHTELAWLLQCYTPIGWLRKMIQFKEKSKKAGGEEVGTGLLTYPVLMAADILLYQTDLVPVGEDQRQHLELSRDIAERFNHLFGGKKWKKMGGRNGRLFKVPDAFIPPAGARVMSLQDGTSKMSKSAESDLSRINLLDPPELIASKLKKAKTDTFDGLELNNPERPEARNLLTIYQLVTGMSSDMVLAECGSMRWGTFKPLLADAVVEHLRPIQGEYERVMKDPVYLDGVLAQGASRASETANQTLENVRQAMGFTPRQL